LLIGVGLLATNWNELWKKHLFLLTSLVPCVIAVIIFHVEIRYLNPIAIIFSLWIALGLANTHPKILRPTIILVFTALAILFVIQAVYFSQNPIGVIKING
jgi:hypothetical protein